MLKHRPRPTRSKVWKPPPSFAYYRSSSLHDSTRPVSFCPLPTTLYSSSPSRRRNPTRTRSQALAADAAVSMYADRTSGRKRSVMDRLGSGGASRSRSDGAKRYALELARFKIVARFAIPVLVGATWSRLLGWIDNQ